MDHFASKSNLKASVLAAHGRGIDLMIVWSIFSERGERHYLWRAVDHEGEVLESYVTKKRDKKAAVKFMKKTMRRYGTPNEIVTDQLGSYGAAARELGCPEKQVT